MLCPPSNGTPCRICAERVRISTCLRPAALWAWGGCEHPFSQPAWRLPRTSNFSHFSPVLSADLSRAGGYAVIKGVCCNILPLRLLLVLGLVLLLLLPPAGLSPGRAKVSWEVSDAPTKRVLRWVCQRFPWPAFAKPQAADNDFRFIRLSTPQNMAYPVADCLVFTF